MILSCHYDIIPWLCPDWIFDTAKGEFTRRCRRQHPKIKLDIYQTNWNYWKLFEDHHYLKLPQIIAAKCYVGTANGRPVAHIGATTIAHGKNGVEARLARFVVMPDWQGIGVGTAFISTVADIILNSKNGSVVEGLPLSSIIATSHPGLSRSLRKRHEWIQIRATLHGDNKTRIRKDPRMKTGYGGHLRAIQTFRYIGPQLR